MSALNRELPTNSRCRASASGCAYCNLQNGKPAPRMQEGSLVRIAGHLRRVVSALEQRIAKTAGLEDWKIGRLERLARLERLEGSKELEGVGDWGDWVTAEIGGLEDSPIVRIAMMQQFLLPLLALVMWCGGLALSNAEGVSTSTPSPEIPFVQSFQDPKYKIEFHPLNSPFTVTEDQETVPMTDREGKIYVCALPNPRIPQNPKAGDAQNGSSSIGLVTDERSSRKTPEELLEDLNQFCYRRDEGWWNYRLCYKSELRQYHVDASSNTRKITQDFLLGHYDEKATAELHRKSQGTFLQKDPRSQSAAQRYHAHLHTNGTKCDLTNEPRQAEVRYVCSENGKPFIFSIKEAPSCKYTVVFHVPALCKHSQFQEEQPPWIPIHCNEVADQ